jgi:anti-anti-sigma factor
MAIDPLPERALSAVRSSRAFEVADAPAQPSLSALSVAVTEHADLVVVVLEGELDIYTASVFRERVRHYDPAEVQMVIDLAQVSLLDPVGLGALLGLRNEAGGAPLGLVCPNRRLGRLLWATGVRAAFVVEDDLAAVCAALPASAAAPGGGS